MDYSQHATWFHRRQGGIHEPTADRGYERLGTYGITSPDSYGQRYPTVHSHMVAGLEDYRQKPRGSSHYNYWAQVPVSSTHSGQHQGRSGRGIYHPTHGGPPWLGVSTGYSGYLPQPVHSRPRTQYQPRPRSARFRVSDSYVPGHGVPRLWTNVYGLGTHAEPDVGGVPRAQKDMFITNQTPRSQRDGHYSAYVDQGANEQFVSQQDPMPQADHRPGFSQGDYDSRWSYGQSSPAHPRTGHRAYYSVPDPVFISRADATGQDCGHRNHGISDKNNRTPAPEQRKPYQRPYPNPRVNRSFATETARYGWQKIAVTSDENIPPRAQPIHEPHSRSERVKRSHPKIPLGPSNTAAPPPPPGSVSSPPEASRFESFYPGYPSEQPRWRSESSTDSDTVDSCFATHNPRHKGGATYHNLPHRTRSKNRNTHQQLRRCALAAASLQLERSKLRREWKKLRREQETLLYGQRRLRYDRQKWKEEQQQHPHRNNDPESTDSRNETESSSESDYAGPAPHKSQRRRAEDLGAGRYRPSTVFKQTKRDPRALLDQYNRQWNTLLSGSSTDIPWPTADLRAATLSKPPFRTPQVLLNGANPQDLLKWSAFNFFTSAFGSRATLKQTPGGIVLNVSTTTPLEVAKAIRNQAREDIKRWHQDKLACRDGELASDERAKAVFAAVFELYGICTEKIRTTS